MYNVTVTPIETGDRVHDNHDSGNHCAIRRITVFPRRGYCRTDAAVVIRVLYACGDTVLLLVLLSLRVHERCCTCTTNTGSRTYRCLRRRRHANGTRSEIDRTGRTERSAFTTVGGRHRAVSCSGGGLRCSPYHTPPTIAADKNDASTMTTAAVVVVVVVASYARASATRESTAPHPRRERCLPPRVANCIILMRASPPL